jgi:hypothetical protein
MRFILHQRHLHADAHKNTRVAFNEAWHLMHSIIIFLVLKYTLMGGSAADLKVFFTL